VVSGVEAAPGRKDPDKVREFVKWARAAEAKE
jgi:phosphoribosylanthranilate isomerase